MSAFKYFSVSDCSISPKPVLTLPGKSVELDCIHNDWTILLLNTGGQTDFNKTWAEFINGFGNVTNGLWLPNDAMFYLTKIKKYYLRIDLWNIDGQFAFAEFDSIKVLSEISYFAAKFGSLINGSTAEDGGLAMQTLPFRTWDKDSAHGCANLHQSGWWYMNDSSCLGSVLTNRANVLSPGKGVYWSSLSSWHNAYTVSIKKVVMRILPKEAKNKCR